MLFGFNLGEIADYYKIGDKVDIVGTLEENVYNGVRKVQIKIQDLRKSI